ncbi:S8 family serine peptidase [Portibacter marinus]|uniref:S8 family serine peptidase n=1 Tax=Portibacter marinus TaxID=2898660 RepID=UPI001F22E198|nr:S8 family serine peptidase [Portibacter marinus]
MIRYHKILSILTLILWGLPTHTAFSQGFAHDKLEKTFATDFSVTLIAHDLSELLELLQRLDCDLEESHIYEEFNAINIDITKDKLQYVRPYISAFDLRSEKPHTEAFLSDYFPEVNAIQAARLAYPKYFNFLDTLSLKENEPDPSDIDLINQILPSTLGSGKMDNHATEMSTIIAGTGNTFYSSIGIAKGSYLLSTDFNNLLPDPLSFFVENGIHIQNHSYGLNVEDYYGIEARAYDEQSYKYPTLLHVFSSGNKGEENAIFSHYAQLEGYSNLTGTFKHAKNVLTVGAIDSFSNLIEVSSVGPAHDGRIKPELVAYGYKGTSDAAAITSGCAAVIRNGLLSEGHRARSDLLKAILIAGADDIGTNGPDFRSGFGKVNLLKSLSIIERAHHLSGTLDQEEDVAEFEVNVEAEHARFVLTWIDPPGEIDTDRALQNDLDLEMEDETGKIHYPYQLNYLPSEITSGEEIGFGRDSINNIEMISLNAPGSYKIRVIKNRLKTDQQAFSLAFYLSDPQDFTFINPYDGSNIEPEKPVYLHFNNLANDTVSNVEFGANVDYTYPETLFFLEEEAQVEGSAITHNGLLAEVTFSVSKIPEIQVLWKCQDSIRIAWTGDSEGDLYQIMKLKGEVLEVIDSTVNRYYTLANDNNLFVAIRKKLAENLYGPHSLTINLSNRNLNCFYEIFSGEKRGSSIELFAKIVALPFYDSVLVEKWSGEMWEEIAILATDEIEQSYIDHNPTSGVNRYRLVFKNNNNENYSEELEIFYVPENEIIVLPTISSPSQGFDVIQGEYRMLDFYLFDATGRVVLKQVLLSAFDFITLEGASSGIYFYAIYNGKDRIQSGKLAVIGL